MDDYTLEARIYWWVALVLGTLILGLSLAQVMALDRGALLQVVAGVSFAVLTGLFPVRLPGRKTSIAGAEIFVFLLLLLHGPGAAALAAAGEAASGSYRTSARMTSRLGSPALAALAMYGCGSGFQFALGRLGGLDAAGNWQIFGTLLVAACAYFATNTLLMVSLLSLKRGAPVRPVSLLREHGWLAVAYVGSASISYLVFVAHGLVGTTVLLMAVPIIAMFLSTVSLFFRQAEAEEQVQRERTAAAEREAAESARHMAALKASEQRFHSAFTHAAVGMMLVARAGRILQTNPALSDQLGWTADELVGRDLFSLFGASEDGAFVWADLNGLLAGKIAQLSTELRCLHRNGNEMWVALHGAQFSAETSGERCLILQMQDMTARKRAEARLQHIAYHDSLTGLPNRASFLEELNRAVEAAKRDPGARFAVMFLDFDRFKLINDSLGHAAGDELLSTAAQRLRRCLRAADLVARLGGDEFALLIERFDAEGELIDLAERIQRALGERMWLANSTVTTSASIGITTSALGYAAADQVMRDADLAMYAAKAQGKARYALFDRAMHSQVSAQLWMENELRQALASDQISTQFQPVFDLRTRGLYGVEALARWQHPEAGMVPPAQFIPLAEDTGLIHALGRRVMALSCQQFARWRQALPRAPALRLHVNVSTAELATTGFAARTAEVIRAAGVPCAQITLEITESTLANEAARSSMLELRAMGLHISVDDFGKGFSSLSALEELPLDEFKIDPSLVRSLENGRGEAVISAVLALGRSLGKQVVVEGIETADQHNLLLQLGCELGQGHLFGQPLAADDVEHLISESTPSLRVAYTRPSAAADGGLRARSTPGPSATP